MKFAQMHFRTKSQASQNYNLCITNIWFDQGRNWINAIMLNYCSRTFSGFIYMYLVNQSLKFSLAYAGVTKSLLRINWYRYSHNRGYRTAEFTALQTIYLFTWKLHLWSKLHDLLSSTTMQFTYNTIFTLFTGRWPHTCLIFLLQLSSLDLH